MKKLRYQIERVIDKTELYWQSLPRPKQRIFTLALLISYILATLLSTLSLWTGGQHSNKVLLKEHIHGIHSEVKNKANVDNTKYINHERAK
ncbi:hypothetical protein [Chryseobacterium indologenes]|uniref:hypothetical protein n=1 Tax=Chryseobacterium indologenes TaxID=253 RepID=UPI00162708E8|nr:hypothetical protein [Chryseobacterium indologenes]MBF6643943.1 hypothetical protein [Chryseobacterium indologenes]MBU3046809.1 hypothetical protein [Chryseobacterium indologenes]QQQ72330.1 hypothetical protein JHW31_06295 [Chryseobacterium indologenes]